MSSSFSCFQNTDLISTQQLMGNRAAFATQLWLSSFSLSNVARTGKSKATTVAGMGQPVRRESGFAVQRGSWYWTLKEGSVLYVSCLLQLLHAASRYTYAQLPYVLSRNHLIQPERIAKVLPTFPLGHGRSNHDFSCEKQHRVTLHPPRQQTKHEILRQGACRQPHAIIILNSPLITSSSAFPKKGNHAVEP